MRPTKSQSSVLNSDVRSTTPTKKPNVTKKYVSIAGRSLPINMHNLDMLFKWMAERDSIQRKRQTGIPPPWSEDPILREHKFCNVFRTLDRGTQYILREVINKGDQTHSEICFRVMLYKLFNRIATWELIEKKLGPTTWSNFSLDKYGRVLLAAKSVAPIYTSAYQIPAPKLGYSTTVMNHLRLLQKMMEEDFPGELLKQRSMRDAYCLIEQYPGMGPFLSFQLLLDLNMSPHVDFDENEWVACGPGSSKCLRMIFGCDVSRIKSQAIEYLYNTQNEHFARLGITDLPRVAEDKPGVSFVDLEHALCECYKYSKLRNIKGKWANPTTRTRSERSVLFTRDLSTPPLKRSSSEPDQFGDSEDEPAYDDIDYEVSHITKQRFGQRGWEYRVRWIGYGPEDDTWLTTPELKDAPEVLREWRAARRKQTRACRRKVKKSTKVGITRPRVRKGTLHALRKTRKTCNPRQKQKKTLFLDAATCLLA
ncbi:hypothetical protein BU17DRAFT_54107 [Hysterangium stoloniferum]|nr:hypothetical protein BU17DRAFT_54107 [Hysterangium stoloniferum]